MEWKDLIQIIIPLLLSLVGYYFAKRAANAKPPVSADKKITFKAPLYQSIFFLFGFIFIATITFFIATTENDLLLTLIMTSLILLLLYLTVDSFFSKFQVTASKEFIHQPAFKKFVLFKPEEIKKVTYSKFYGSLVLQLYNGKKVNFSSLFAGKVHFYKLLLSCAEDKFDEKALKLIQDEMSGKKVTSIF